MYSCMHHYFVFNVFHKYTFTTEILENVIDIKVVQIITIHFDTEYPITYSEDNSVDIWPEYH